MWNFLGPAQRIAQANPWLKWAVVVLVGMFALEFIAQRGVALFKEIATASVDVRVQNARAANPNPTSEDRERVHELLKRECATNPDFGMPELCRQVASEITLNPAIAHKLDVSAQYKADLDKNIQCAAIANVSLSEQKKWLCENHYVEARCRDAFPDKFNLVTCP